VDDVKTGIGIGHFGPSHQALTSRLNVLFHNTLRAGLRIYRT